MTSERTAEPNETGSELEQLRRRVVELEQRLAERGPDDAPADPPRNDPYRELFERSADAILVIEGENFIDCNQATVAMLRYGDRAALLQTHPSELSPEYQPDGRRSYEKANEMIAIAFERGSHRFEWDHMRADGEVFPVEVLLTAVPEGGRRRLHVVWRDITERKRLEASLRHAQKMEAVGKLAGGVAHDFNNLLVSILGHVDLLRDDIGERDELLEPLAQIRKAATRAAELTAKLLAFSRKQVLQPRTIDMGASIGSMLRMLERLLGPGVTLRSSAPEQPVPIRIDPAQFEQLILNLVQNARDAMPRGGELSLHTSEVTRAGRTCARLEVADNGSGMNAETLAHAFDPFYTTKQRGRGTGLGLASVYGIVKQSGGDVTVASAPEQGTTFEIILPLSQEPAAPPDRTPPPPPHATSTGTILVSEDDPAVGKLIGRVLRRHGYEVQLADHGQQALELAQAEPERFDLLLTDVVMPGMSGPELSRRLAESGLSLPTLFMSGYTDDALAQQGFDAGDVALLRKPFAVQDLLDRVGRLLTTRS